MPTVDAPLRGYWYRDAETQTPEIYDEQQGHALRRQLAYISSHSAFYQEKFRTAGLRSDDVRSLADLDCVPFTEKSELRHSQTMEPPLHVRAEHGEASGDLAALKADIETLLREKLIFRADVELLPPGSLPRYEYKAKLVRNLYEGEA